MLLVASFRVVAPGAVGFVSADGEAAAAADTSGCPASSADASSADASSESLPQSLSVSLSVSLSLSLSLFGQGRYRQQDKNAVKDIM